MSLWSELMLTLHIMLLILAVVAFAGAALDVKFWRLNLTGFGLFCWALAVVLMGK